MFVVNPKDIIHRITRSTNTAAISVNTKLVIQFPTALANKKVCVTNFAFDHTGGAAANHAGRWYDGADGATTPADGIGQKQRSSSIAVATMITPASLQSGPGGQGNMLTLLLDANARAYFTPGPDAGADNTYQWFVDYYELYYTAGQDSSG